MTVSRGKQKKSEDKAKQRKRRKVDGEYNVKITNHVRIYRSLFDYFIQDFIHACLNAV